MYDDILDNPKIQRLPDKVFKTWVNLLCVARRHGGILPPACDLAFALRLDEKEIQKHVTTLINAGLIDKIEGPNGNNLSPHNWEIRQFNSDVSTDRVRAFRERSKEHDETLDETFHSDVSETKDDVSRNGFPSVSVVCNSVVTSRIVESQQEEVEPLPLHARGRQ
jgi:hypothetical protein